MGWAFAGRGGHPVLRGLKHLFWPLSRGWGAGRCDAGGRRLATRVASAGPCGAAVCMGLFRG